MPLIIPGPGSRDAYSRRADSWPRHKAKVRQRSRRYANAGCSERHHQHVEQTPRYLDPE